MEAVDRANARGSVTSLPDLIKRATRLAAMIDRGKRPASRFDDLNYLDEKAGRDSERYSGMTKLNDFEREHYIGFHWGY